MSSDKIRIAVIGCLHGELDDMYSTISSSSLEVDLILVCGDFESIRNEADLDSKSSPAKYKKMGYFSDYYNGVKTAPILTVFIGGNHEASNLLTEHSHGGFLAHNIYYMGQTSVVNFRGVRIGGLSGIFKSKDYRKGRYETFPFDCSDIRSVYHYREIDTYRFMHLRRGHGGIDIFMSHDWPQWIWEYCGSNWVQDIQRRFSKQMISGSLGTPPLKCILDHVQPKLWFAAHLHVKFAAVYPHHNTSSDDTEISHPAPVSITKFLALDKVFPERDFLQIIEVDSSKPSSSELEYDVEWLAIMRKTYSLQSRAREPPPLPFNSIQPCSDEEIEDVRATVLAANEGTLKINRNSTNFLIHNVLSSSSYDDNAADDDNFVFKENSDNSNDNEDHNFVFEDNDSEDNNSNNNRDSNNDSDDDNEPPALKREEPIAGDKGSLSTYNNTSYFRPTMLLDPWQVIIEEFMLSSKTNLSSEDFASFILLCQESSKVEVYSHIDIYNFSRDGDVDNLTKALNSMGKKIFKWSKWYKDDNGDRATHASVRNGHINCVKLLLNKILKSKQNDIELNGADKSFLNIRNEQEHTLLHLAAKAGNKDIVRLLLAIKEIRIDDKKIDSYELFPNVPIEFDCRDLIKAEREQQIEFHKKTMGMVKKKIKIKKV